MRFIRNALPHIALALILGLLLLAVLDSFNPLMAFLTSSPSKLYIVITCFFTVSACISSILRNRE